jgi:ribosomal protein S18 acetylase RimI-like enzyme
MSFTVRQMEITDYDTVFGLWERSEAIILSGADSREHIQKLLERNVGLSYVALVDEMVVGAVLCSHDGRMGYLTHLVVSEEQRRQGIGRQLVSRCMFALMSLGIHQCVLLIMKETDEALNFWRRVDPAGRVSLVMMAPR